MTGSGDYPLVTIGVPVYNGAEFIRESLESLLNQTYTNLEILVSDNGSTDDTVDLVAAMAATDNRIRLIRQPTNLGAARNYNLLVDEAGGRYFKWHAHDDLCEPTMIERCVAALLGPSSSGKGHPVLAYTSSVLIDEHGRETERIEDRLEVDGPVGRRLRHLIRRMLWCNAVFGVFDTEVLRTTRLIGSFRSSDVDLLYATAIRGEFAHVPEFLFIRRVHQGASLQANQTARSQAAWFDPRRARRVQMPVMIGLFGAHVRTVVTAPVPVSTRLAAGAALVRYWPRLFARRTRSTFRMWRRRRRAGARPAEQALSDSGGAPVAAQVRESTPVTQP